MNDTEYYVSVRTTDIFFIASILTFIHVTLKLADLGGRDLSPGQDPWVRGEDRKRTRGGDLTRNISAQRGSCKVSAAIICFENVHRYFDKVS